MFFRRFPSQIIKTIMSFETKTLVSTKSETNAEFPSQIEQCVYCEIFVMLSILCSFIAYLSIIFVSKRFDE